MRPGWHTYVEMGNDWHAGLSAAARALDFECPAALNLCGIHLCYLFFRLVAMPCDRGLPAALHGGQTVEIPAVQRLRVVWRCVAGCRDTVGGSRWKKMPHLRRCGEQASGTHCRVG